MRGKSFQIVGKLAFDRVSLPCREIFDPHLTVARGTKKRKRGIWARNGVLFSIIGNNRRGQDFIRIPTMLIDIARQPDAGEKFPPRHFNDPPRTRGLIKRARGVFLKFLRRRRSRGNTVNGGHSSNGTADV